MILPRAVMLVSLLLVNACMSASEPDTATTRSLPQPTGVGEEEAKEDDLLAEPPPDAPPQADGAHAASTAPATFDVDTFVRALPEEAMVFNVPATMQLEETVRVRLLIQPGSTGVDLVAEFTRAQREDERGELVQDVAPVGGEMGARLQSAGLEITALTPENQLVSPTEPTEWRWDLEAAEGGLHELELGLYAIAPGRSSGRMIRTYQREMMVEVSMRAWAAGVVAAHWEWLWTLFLAPVGAWLWRRRRIHAAR